MIGLIYLKWGGRKMVVKCGYCKKELGKGEKSFYCKFCRCSYCLECDKKLRAEQEKKEE